MAFYECEIHGRRRLAFDLAASSWFKAQTGIILFDAAMKSGDAAPLVVRDHDLTAAAFAAALRKDMPKITIAKAMEIIQSHLDANGEMSDVWEAIFGALNASRIYGATGKDETPKAES